MSNPTKSNKKPGSAWLFSLLLLAVSTQAGTLPLSHEVDHFLKQHRQLTICYPDIHYQPYFQQGKGLVPDLVAQLAELLGVETKNRIYPDWQQAKEAYRQGHCDLLPLVSAEGVGSELGPQSAPLMTVMAAMLYRTEEDSGPVLMQPAWFSHVLLNHFMPERTITPAQPSVSIPALLHSEPSYAYLGDYLSLRELLRQHPDLNVRIRLLEHDHWQMSMRLVMRDEPSLREAINTAVRYLPPANVYRLLDSYAISSAGSINLPEWSDEEQSWLARTQVLRVAINPGLPPFASRDRNGVPVGWSVDMLRELLRPHGIRVEWRGVRDREEGIRLLRSGEIDMMLGVPESSALAEVLRFTRIMVMSHWALLSRDGLHANLKELDGETVWVPASLWDPSLLERLGKADWQPVPSVVEGAARLRRGEGRALLADLYQLQYPLRLNQLQDLSISDLVDERWGLPFAIAPNRPMLERILNKAMMGISPVQQDELRQRWLQLSVTQVEGVSYGFWISSTLLLLLSGGVVIFLIWRSRRQLALEIERRRLVEQGLSEARQRAEAAAQAKGRFMAAISHEIRTPMNAIIGLLEWLAGTRLGQEQSRALERVRQATDELLGLLNDILDFTRNEQHSLALTPQRVDLAWLCERVIAIHWPKAKARHIALSLSISADLPETLWLDPHRMAQILHNLLSNGIKFTEQGTVRVILTRLDSQLLLQVEDEGPGIDASLRSRLFLPFEQGRDAQQTGEGTGLGLAITHQLVTQMEGSIGVMARRPKGSCFWCRLPLVQPEHPLPRRRQVSRIALHMPAERRLECLHWLARMQVIEDASAEPLIEEPDEYGLPCWRWRGQQLVPGSMLSVLAEEVGHDGAELPRRGDELRVLLVEDHELNRHVLAMQLQQLGAMVTMAEDGAVALTLLEQGLMVDLILTDLQMPRLDGADLCLRLKQEPRWRHLPVYVITADLSVQAIKRLEQCGCDGRLDKPVRRQELAALLQRYVPSPVVSDLPLLDEATLALYCETNRRDLDAVMHCWRAQDWPGWAAQLHRIKGSAKMVGARELVRLIDAWEQRREWDAIDALQQMMEETEQRLRQHDQHHQ